MSKNEQSHKEKPVSELLQEQSKELKTYIDTKHREMEELLAESEGQISGEFLYLYPPGIPMLVPGERIEKELLEKLENYRKLGFGFQGLEDFTGRRIAVVEIVWSEKVDGNDLKP